VSKGSDPGRRRRSGNPAVRAGAAEPRPPTARREELERRSRPWLVRLAALPRWSVVVAVLVLTIAGLLLPGIAGAVVLLLVAALATWLTALSWPVISPGARGARVAILLLLVVDAGFKVLTR
jgi:uncharacterized protein DUF6703